MGKAKPNTAGYRPSSDEVSASLMTDHIGAKPTDLSAVKTDPVVPTPMVINLDDMDTYDSNPRKGENPVFDDLYDRIIAQRGLTDVLNITRQPGNEKYILSAGGNTRLAALRKAYNDTSETIYSKFYALFVPFESESSILIGHLAENGQRAGVSFIENALGVIEAQKLLQTETGTEFSQREFALAIKEKGFTVHQPLIGLYQYAADKLLKCIPKTLFDGLGRPRIVDIKNFESRFWEYVEFKGLTRQQFDLIFVQILSEHDSDEGFNVDKVKDYLTIALCEALDIDVYVFQVECDAFHLDGPDSLTFKQPILSSEIASDTDQNFTTSLADEDQSESSSSRITEKQSDRNKPKKSQGNTMHPIAQQRRTCMRIAIRLAQHFKIDACIRTNYDIGFGFFVDFPDKPIDDPVIASVWWVLYSACGLSIDPYNRLLVTEDNLVMKQLFMAKPDDLDHQFMNRVGENDMFAFSQGLLFNPDIEERHIRDIMDLSFACRKLLITANQYGMTQELWTYK